MAHEQAIIQKKEERRQKKSENTISTVVNYVLQKRKECKRSKWEAEEREIFGDDDDGIHEL